MGCVYMYIHIRNIINNTVITFYGDRWLLDFVVIIFCVYLMSYHFMVHLKLPQYCMLSMIQYNKNSVKKKKSTQCLPSYIFLTVNLLIPLHVHTPHCHNLQTHICVCVLLLLLSCFSRVRLCATPQRAAHQAPPSLGFSRQEHWSGLPFPSPMHESEK